MVAVKRREAGTYITTAANIAKQGNALEIVWSMSS